MRKTWISSISSFSKIVCYRIIINNLIKFLCQLEDTEKNPKKPKKKKKREGESPSIPQLFLGAT